MRLIDAFCKDRLAGIEKALSDDRHQKDFSDYSLGFAYWNSPGAQKFLKCTLIERWPEC